MFACVHFLLLDEPDSELAQWYPNVAADHRTADDPALMPTFSRFVQDHGPALVELLATQKTQTNEVGRCGFFLPRARPDRA